MPQIKRKEYQKSSLKHNGLKTGALLHSRRKGSLTVETALVLPWFLFAMVAVLFLFRVLQLQYMVGEALDKAVAQTALIKDATAKEVENKVKLLFYAELTKQDCPVSMVARKMAGFSWNNSKVDESHIRMKVKYNIKIPGWVFSNKELKVTECSSCRRWNGVPGNATYHTAEDWVYITLKGNVYHRIRECTHLKLSIHSVSAKQAEKYRACEICAKGKIRPVVYIAEEGDCYHVNMRCRGLKRTIYMVPITQTKGRSLCQRCGGG